MLVSANATFTISIFYQTLRAVNMILTFYNDLKSLFFMCDIVHRLFFAKEWGKSFEMQTKVKTQNHQYHWFNIQIENLDLMFMALSRC